MKFTYDWLKDYLETDLDAADVADELTRIGLEIESVEAVPVPVVAKIISVEDIPETHLHLLSVDDGGGTPRQVVCGAPNVRPGLVSVLARPGTIIEGNEIKVGKLRGYESNGMMCSERELGLSDNHTGITELDEAKYKIGAAYGSTGDVVYDGKVLPNRADYLAVMGIARDLIAAGCGTAKSPSLAKGWTAPQARDGVVDRKAIIKSAQCDAYNFAEIRGIKIAASTKKIAARLAAVGINPKNAPVDATNFVCIDLGQPLHCFDADQVKGDIIIRNATEGEEFTDLFDAKHILTTDDLVITDADGILALAGIVGGKRGMTTDKTTNIIIESAHFDAIGTRRTRSRLGISTDASYRFERGVDPLISPTALAAAVEIITARCGGEVIAVRAETDFTPVVIKYNPSGFARIAGIEVAPDEQKKILERLGYIVNADWSVVQPSWRVDDALPEKLVADIIRIYGYDKLSENREQRTENRNPTPDPLKIFLARTRGLTEHNSYGFGNLYFERVVSDKANIKIANPVADTINTARNGLVANML
ncbi:MAG: phenylalanine--tRNA ligase subunit beta, partial [Rickettsiales bacterium]|nr:phenylalanine--tRNA ligase subunit beta [Rickettsiales bacterium]